MSEHVLVTGASGFLGYHLVKAAIKENLVVYAAIRKNSNVSHLADLPVKYIYLDYEDVDDMVKQLSENKIRYIIHAAGVTKAIRQETYNYVNAELTVNLAKAGSKLAEPLKKFVFISSLAAVGPLPNEADKITEDTPPKPVTAYGKSKLLAEQKLSALAIPYTTLRPTAVYGPRDKDIFIMIKSVCNGLDPYIGRFGQRLSFVHAEDVAIVAVKSLFIDEARGAYNITDGKSYDRYALADTVKKLVHKKAFRFHIPMGIVRVMAFSMEKINGWLNKPSVINREKLHELAARNWICDIDKAKNDLHFIPKYDLSTGLEESVNWYTTNKWL